MRLDIFDTDTDSDPDVFRLILLFSEQAVEQALKTLDGTAPQPFRYGTVLSPPDSAGLAHDAEVEKKIQEWLKKKGLK